MPPDKVVPKVNWPDTGLSMPVPIQGRQDRVGSTPHPPRTLAHGECLLQAGHPALPKHLSRPAAGWMSAGQPEILPRKVEIV